MLHDYSHAALDLAMVCRKSVTSGDTAPLVSCFLSGEETILRSAEVRAGSRELRTGVANLSLEEETQALLVAVLCADPLAWVPSRRVQDAHTLTQIGGRVGVVDVNHSPQGSAKSLFQAAAMQRAGARAGWPDLDVRLVTPSGPHAVLLELKVGKGRESATQRLRRDRLVASGHDARLVRGLGEALMVVVELLIGAEVVF